VHVRLSLYKRVAAAESDAELDELTAELHDRFGPLPPAAVSLIRIAKLKLAARSLGVRRLDLGPQGGSVLFEERTAVDPASLVRLIQKSAREYRLDGPQKLRISRPMPTDQARFEYAGELLGRLGAAARPRPPG
jgi:transcription-repair coupling factor (superfamily II helicase)